MVGVKGSGGPVPKRSDQRRRKNVPAAGEPTSAEGVAAAQPPGDAEWHPVARRWYESLGDAGQNAFYQSSDWATAWVLAEAISRELKPQPVVVGSGESAQVEMLSMPMKGATLSAFLKGCTALLTTEGDRRRAAIELTVPRPPGSGDQPPAGVTDIRSWREGLSG